MKTTQRKFVVEYKSPRRQNKASSTSIWGDANLKELLEQAEAEIPGAPDAATPLEEQAALPQSSANMGLDEVAPPAVSVDTVSPQVVSEPVREAPPVEKNSATTDARSKSKQGPKPKRTRTNQTSSAQRGTSILQSADSFGSVTMDDGDLAALEAENRHLKKLLVQHLLKENETLRVMLAR